MEPPRKKTKLSPDGAKLQSRPQDDESTDFKLAILASLHPDRSQNILLDYLLAYHGSVEDVSQALTAPMKGESPRKRNAINGVQSSLASFATREQGDTTTSSKSLLTKKGRTLHLYSPEDIETHTPCSIVHNFLAGDVADALLQELLSEEPSFRRDKFQMFDRAVESPHTVRLYVNDWDNIDHQNSQYTYNGGYINNIAQTPPELLRVSELVTEKVNDEIDRRMHIFQSNGSRLKFQSPERWIPNASFVNCYTGGAENVGWHSDHLTYLGPRAIIGSLSLGVTREFRVRKIVPQIDAAAADTQGQIAIHLPHNSLLVMHAEMQEEWKHSIAPAKSIDPHPVAGNRRFNVTYRAYKDYLHPSLTPRCRCDVAAVLRCVQKRAATRGRYMWMCHNGFTVGQKSCGWFTWAELDEDGKPSWCKEYKGNANGPVSTIEESSATVKPTADNEEK